MATVQMVGEQRFVFDHVNWEAYEALLKTWQDLPVRMTYDRGDLEIMSPLLSHEQFSALLAQMVQAYTLELKIPRHSGGSTTFRQTAKQRGLEPDECYWIQHEPRMRSRKDFDPDKDPPPDLAIEVDITSSSLDRMSIYADLGVPEVWRFDGETLTFNLLQGERYEPGDRSRALPALTPAVLMRFLQLSDRMGETEVVLAFLDWVREEGKTETPTPKPRRPRKK